MRTLALALAAALLALAAPTATADDRPCKDAKVDATIVDVYTYADCTVEVVVFEDLACLWGTEKHSKNVGPATLTYYECAPPEGSEPSAAGPAACPEEGLFFGLWGSRVELHADCTADVILFPNVICVGGNTARVDRTVGPAHVQVTFCTASPGP